MDDDPCREAVAVEQKRILDLIEEERKAYAAMEPDFHEPEKVLKYLARRIKGG